MAKIKINYPDIPDEHTTYHYGNIVVLQKCVTDRFLCQIVEVVNCGTTLLWINNGGWVEPKYETSIPDLIARIYEQGYTITPVEVEINVRYK